jgi:hypothetical protein
VLAMILGEINRAPGITTTLDDLFRRAGVRHPDAPAVADPPDRASFTDGAPRTLSYAQADHAISAVAARLRALGLQTDAVVAMQLPNTVESVIACLGILRAGMIVAPLPLLWRRRDLVDALGRVSARAILTCARAGSARPAEVAMHTAAALFPIRHICSFGQDLPDGVVPIDDVFTPGAYGSALPPRPDSAASHLAAITFDIDARGVNPAARNHTEIISGGLAVFLESAIAPDAHLLSTIPISSFAGLALTLAPWLLSGGTLHLHHGFDATAFAAQCGAAAYSMLVFPAPALRALTESGVLANVSCTFATLWRAPERASAAKSFNDAAAVVDISSFGETGLVAARRTEQGKPAPIPHGVISAPRGVIGAMTVVETACSNAGTLMLRGPMVPSKAYPPDTDPGRAPDPAGYVDTGFSCRLDKHGQSFTITVPPPGIVGIGGYRLRQSDIDSCVEKAAAEAGLLPLPDRMLGHRLAGAAQDKKAVAIALEAQGVNALISGAFRERGTADAA